MAELNELIRKMKRLNVHSKVTQRVIESVHVDTDKRIFTKGLDSKNSRIGLYTKSYVKYGRKKEGWGTSRKVILQLTGAMQTDWKFLVLPGGNYGSGFTASATSKKGKSLTNFEKSFMVEQTYGKQIFTLTDKENKSIGIRMEKELTRFLAKL